MQVRDSLFNCDNQRLLLDQNSLLSTLPDAEEIKLAVFGLGSLSSPSIDGFSECFYTFCWDIIGDSVVAAVQNFSSFGKLLKASTNFILSLVAKCANPSSFHDFRPICLLNFSFKIIIKILANRLSKILPTIVSSYQAAFVKGKSIHDHLALVHEIAQKLTRN